MKKFFVVSMFVAVLLITGKANGADSFKITWDQEPPVDGYYLDRKIGVNGTYSQVLDITNGNLREIEDSTVKMGNEYCYRLWSYRNNDPGQQPPILKSADPSNEDCEVLSGIELTIPTDKKLLISRRNTNTSSIVSILVNKDEPVTQASVPAPTGVTINVKSGVTLQTSRRSLNASSVISILVNKDEVVRVNNVIQ